MKPITFIVQLQSGVGWQCLTHKPPAKPSTPPTSFGSFSQHRTDLVQQARDWFDPIRTEAIGQRQAAYAKLMEKQVNYYSKNPERMETLSKAKRCEIDIYIKYFEATRRVTINASKLAAYDNYVDMMR